MRRLVGFGVITGALALGSCRPAPPLRPAPEAPRGFSEHRRHTRSDCGALFGFDAFAPEEKRTEIVFAAARDGSGPQLFILSRDGGSWVQKTFPPGVSAYPKFSPDGSLIAYAANPEGHFNIYLQSTSGAGWVEELTNEPGNEIHPSWSPDGRKVAYSAQRGDGPWVIRIKDLGTQRVSEIGPGLFPEWSPTGERLAFERRGVDGKLSVWTVGIHSESPTRVVAYPDRSAASPSWSPDGRRIVFTSVGTGPRVDRYGLPARRHGSGLIIVDLPTSAQMGLEAGGGPLGHPVWGLDGWVYYEAVRGGEQGVYSVRPADEPARVIGSEAGESEGGPRGERGRPGN